ncbi:hypothetical protein ACFQE2_15410 [Methylophaga thalassica]|uniref:hypothetical protein n=1 Tax=Methylophaga thalassica TaxID=40223 RepID=UPI00362281A3
MIFTMKVIHDGAVRLIEIEAGNANQARYLAERQGHHVLSINQQKSGALSLGLPQLKKPNSM